MGGAFPAGQLRKGRTQGFRVAAGQHGDPALLAERHRTLGIASQGDAGGADNTALFLQAAASGGGLSSSSKKRWYMSGS